MAIGSPQWMYSSGEDAFTIDQSLRFNDDDSAYLSWTPTNSQTNNKIGTWSFWTKKTEVTDDNEVVLFDSRNAAGTLDHINIGFHYDDDENSLAFSSYEGSLVSLMVTSMQFRDPSAWYHIVIAYDSTQSTASDRIEIYINGEQVTEWEEETYPAQNKTLRRWANQDSPINIGRTGRTSNHSYYDGYLSEVHYIDGQALTPADFGETGDYGEWKPIEYSGTYGTNGFYLDFADSSALGDDESGNTNDWTVNNLTASDQMLDSPTNNFCTLNPLDKGANLVTSEGNLKLTGSSGWQNLAGSFYVETGKWYFEVLYSAGSYIMIGAADSLVSKTENFASPDNSWSYHGGTMGDGQKFGDGVSGSSYGTLYDTADDIIGVALNMDAGTIAFYLNNVAQGTAFTSLSDKSLAPFISIHNAGDAVVYANFGQDSSFAGEKTAQGNQDGNSIGDFYYTPPTGFLALCTSNLPDVDVVPSEHFNTVLYSGNDSTNNLTTGFQPDLVWIKSRNASNYHNLHDSLRTASMRLSSNTTDEENDGSAGGDTPQFYSFDSNGFTLSTSNENTNSSSYNYVAWNWKANGSGSSNTNGSITSTVSANTDAGFSIVSFTGTNANGATIGHGLSSAPEMVIVKTRSASGENWRVYHSGIASDAATDYVNLNTTAAAADLVNIWNDTAPTSSVFSVGQDGGVNANGTTYIAYCFHSVDGYSKIGSYEGNDDADGTFVYTGFRPAYVMIKSTNAYQNWQIFDNKRDSYNEAGRNLRADITNVEGGASGLPIDFLSNGFKLRIAGDWTNDDTLIYLAFAETPFKYSNAR